MEDIEEVRRSCSNFKHDEAVVLNSDIKAARNGGGKKNTNLLINCKAVVEDSDF